MLASFTIAVVHQASDCADPRPKQIPASENLNLIWRVISLHRLHRLWQAFEKADLLLNDVQWIDGERGGKGIVMNFFSCLLCADLMVILFGQG